MYKYEICITYFYQHIFNVHFYLLSLLNGIFNKLMIEIKLIIRRLGEITNVNEIHSMYNHLLNATQCEFKLS